MSISNVIAMHRADGLLVALEPVAPMSQVRPVFLVPEVHNEIIGPWTDNKKIALMPQVREALENFLSGNIVTVTFKKSPNTDFKRLQDHAKHIWEVRIVRPKPGVRVFGLFASKDIFVATNILMRNELNYYVFREMISAAKARWRVLFPSYAPVVSEQIYDYISQNVVQFPQ